MKYVLIGLLMLARALGAQPKTVECKSADDVLNAIRSLAPGSEIILHDGTFTFPTRIVIEAKGTKEKPITIRAKNRKTSVIGGKTSMLFRNSSFVIVEGLVFENDGSSAVRLEGCNNIRITRNIFRLKEEGKGSWVMVTGNNDDTLSLSHHNAIDHNLFENKRELGNFLTIEGTKKHSPAVSQYDVIEWNHFRNIGPRAENVLEAIRIGASDYTLSRGFTLLQNNLFERCDGDPEYISIKQSNCTVRNNTFIECLGSLSLRHGNACTVEGNVIIGNNRTGTFLDSTGKRWTLGTGGIRFCADSMIIVGNYCEGLTGKEWDATVAATNGDADYGEGKSLTKHYRITNALVAHNYFINNVSGIEIGFDGAGFQGNWWNKPPMKMVVRSNVITGNSDTLIKFLDATSSVKFENNIVFPTGSAVSTNMPAAGIEVSDPRLVRIAGLWLPETMDTSAMKLRRLTHDDVGPDAP